LTESGFRYESRMNGNAVVAKASPNLVHLIAVTAKLIASRVTVDLD